MIRSQFDLDRLNLDYWQTLSKVYQKKNGEIYNLLSEEEVSKIKSNSKQSRDQSWKEYVSNVPLATNEYHDHGLINLILMRISGRQGNVIFMLEQPFIHINLKSNGKIDVKLNEINWLKFIKKNKNLFPSEMLDQMKLEDFQIDMSDLVDKSKFIQMVSEIAAYIEFVSIVSDIKEKFSGEVLFFNGEASPFTDITGNLYLPYKFYFSLSDDEKRALLFHEAIHASQIPGLPFVLNFMREYGSEVDYAQKMEFAMMDLMIGMLKSEVQVDFKFVVMFREQPDIIQDYLSLLEKTRPDAAQQDILEYRINIIRLASKLSARDIEEIVQKISSIDQLMKAAAMAAQRSYDSNDEALSFFLEVLFGSKDTNKIAFAKMYLKSGLVAGFFIGSRRSQALSPSEKEKWAKDISIFIGSEK